MANIMLQHWAIKSWPMKFLWITRLRLVDQWKHLIKMFRKEIVECRWKWDRANNRECSEWLPLDRSCNTQAFYFWSNVSLVCYRYETFYNKLNVLNPSNILLLSLVKVSSVILKTKSDPAMLKHFTFDNLFLRPHTDPSMLKYFTVINTEICQFNFQPSLVLCSIIWLINGRSFQC